MIHVVILYFFFLKLPGNLPGAAYPIYAENTKNGALFRTGEEHTTVMKFYCSTQRSSRDIAMGESRGKRLSHRILSLFLSFYEAFFVFFFLSNG